MTDRSLPKQQKHGSLGSNGNNAKDLIFNLRISR